VTRFALPAPEPETTVVWESPEFHDELATWCADVLGEPVRLENVKQRAWSTVWRVQAGDRLFYAKQNCRQQAFEAVLVARLAELVPTHVVPPAGVDAERGLLLTADAGEVLGDHALADIEAWCRVVAQWAEVQQRLVGEELGLTPMLASDAEEYVAERVAALAALPATDPRAMPAETAARLDAHLPVVRRWAEQVSALDLPVTLNHNDLHAFNVFVPRAGGALRFFDFGDSVVGDPLSALLIPLNMLAREGTATDELERVARAFLEVWTDRASYAELREVLPASLQLARLMRHESWVRTMAPMSAAQLEEFGDAPAQWLETLMEPPPVR
jgi:hypothetical protein